MVVQKYRRGEKPAVYKEKISKKKKNTDTALLRVGIKVTIKTGKTEERTGIVYQISKKGAVKLLIYKKWWQVIRIIDSDNKNGDIRARDSTKKNKRLLYWSGY